MKKNKTFTWQEYEEFDSTMKFLSEKQEAIKKYNLKNKTDYLFISQYIHKLAEQKKTAKEISEPLDITKTAVSYILRKMDVKPLSVGGPNCITFLSKNDLKKIRMSKKKLKAIAGEYGVSTPTIYKIRHREGRWAKE